MSDSLTLTRESPRLAASRLPSIPCSFRHADSRLVRPGALDFRWPGHALSGHRSERRIEPGHENAARLGARTVPRREAGSDHGGSLGHRGGTGPAAVRHPAPCRSCPARPRRRLWAGRRLRTRPVDLAHRVTSATFFWQLSETGLGSSRSKASWRASVSAQRLPGIENQGPGRGGSAWMVKARQIPSFHTDIAPGDGSLRSPEVPKK